MSRSGGRTIGGDPEFGVVKSRHKIGDEASKKSFTMHAVRKHPKNFMARSVMRGGYRL
jgi:hypothetical protein